MSQFRELQKICYCWKRGENLLLDKLAELAQCLKSAVCSQQGAGRWSCKAWPRACEWVLLLQTPWLPSERAGLYCEIVSLDPCGGELAQGFGCSSTINLAWLEELTELLFRGWQLLGEEGKGSGVWWLCDQPAHLNPPQTRDAVFRGGALW